MEAIQGSVVLWSLALIRCNPYATLVSPKKPSIGLLSPGLTRICPADGLPNDLAFMGIPLSLKTGL